MPAQGKRIAGGRAVVAASPRCETQHGVPRKPGRVNSNTAPAAHLHAPEGKRFVSARSWCVVGSRGGVFSSQPVAGIRVGIRVGRAPFRGALSDVSRTARVPDRCGWAGSRRQTHSRPCEWTGSRRRRIPGRPLRPPGPCTAPQRCSWSSADSCSRRLQWVGRLLCLRTVAGVAFPGIRNLVQ